MTLNRPQIPEHLWAVPAAWRPELIDLHHHLTTLDPHHLVSQVMTRKGNLRIHILPSRPMDEEDHVVAALHNLMWQHVHRTEERILAHASNQGERMSFLSTIKEELHEIIAKLEGKGEPVVEDLKAVAEKVATQAEAEAKEAAPVVEADLKADAAEAVQDVAKAAE